MEIDLWSRVKKRRRRADTAPRSRTASGTTTGSTAPTAERPEAAISYSLVHLSVRSDVLFRVIHYSNRQASGPGSWDAAKFSRDLDHATLFDLVLAPESLGNQGLLDLTCHTVADMIRDKLPTQIRAMFGIRPPQGKKTKNKLMTPEQKEALELEERALRALHTVPCHEFTIYDPKHNCFLYTRFFYFCNMAFFDHDKECECYQFFYLFNSSPYSLIYLAI
jgi:hypothetical protein